MTWDGRPWLRNPHYNTPNVDRLFADGMNFERAYVTQPQPVQVERRL